MSVMQILGVASLAVLLGTAAPMVDSAVPTAVGHPILAPADSPAVPMTAAEVETLETASVALPAARLAAAGRMDDEEDDGSDWDAALVLGLMIAAGLILMATD